MSDWIWLCLAAVVACEIIARIFMILHDRSGRRMPPRLAMSIWFCNVFSTGAYLAPATFLAETGSVAMMMAAMLWIFGTMVYLSNSFVALPFYNRTQIVPATLIAVSTFWVARLQTIHPGSVSEWWIATVLMAIYVANTFETINAQKDTQVALDAARADASARLIALERMTRIDPLTGLINRSAFDEVLADWLILPGGGGSSQIGGRVAVFVVDLDGFKPINDTYSHAAGDAVLIALAQRLNELADGHGLAARLGGDEFILALRDVASEGEAMDFAGRILAEIDRPILYGDRNLHLSASIGIALALPGQIKVAAICANADKAMYSAKGDQGVRAVLFDPTRHHPRASLEDRRTLLAALVAGEFRLHYQPKVDLASGRIIGFEALARWDHPARGMLLPRHFLGQVSELGLQADFQAVMARQVMRDIESFLEAGVNPGQVSFNISEAALATLSGRLDLDGIIADHPTAAPHLTLEITEDVFIARASGMIQASIAHYRAAGLRVALDDFGTGFASFQHLRQFEFDELKIDRSFVADLGKSPAADVLVEGFITIARGLGATVIAEGVETQAQKAALMKMGCEKAQGYLFGRAVAPADALRILGGRPAGPPTLRLAIGAN